MNNNITQRIAEKEQELKRHKIDLAVAKDQWSQVDEELKDVRERHNNIILIWSEQYNAVKRLEAEIELLRTME